MIIILKNPTGYIIIINKNNSIIIIIIIIKTLSISSFVGSIFSPYPICSHIFNNFICLPTTIEIVKFFVLFFIFLGRRK